jgi:hypothetical protein
MYLIVRQTANPARSNICAEIGAAGSVNSADILFSWYVSENK